MKIRNLISCILIIAIFFYACPSTEAKRESTSNVNGQVSAALRTTDQTSAASSGPTLKLQQVFSQRPFQIQEPKKTKIIFLGLDANLDKNISFPLTDDLTVYLK